MANRALCLTLALLAAVPLAAQRRRSVTPGDPLRCAYGTLAEASDPLFVAIDGTHVYVANDFSGRIERVPKRGGAVETVYEVPLEDFVFSMTVDDADVYLGIIPFSDQLTLPPGSVIAIPKNGGEPRTIATGIPLPNEIATDETHVFWVASGTIDFQTGEADSDGRIERANKDGSGRQTLAQGLSLPFSLVLDGGYVYFSELGQAKGNPSAGVRRIPKTGGTVQKLTEGWIAADLRQSANEIVFLGAHVDESQVGIHAVSKGGGPVRTIVSDENVYAGPRVFGEFAYYTTLADDAEDDLMRVPLAGGAPVFLRPAHTGYPDFEVDGCAVYYGHYEDLTVVAVPR